MFPVLAGRIEKNFAYDFDNEILNVDGKTYVPFSYFQGATPDNDYTPSEPFQIVVESNATSDDVQGYKKLVLHSSGADSPRTVMLRMRGDGTWFLWEHYLLVGIRVPKSADPWA